MNYLKIFIFLITLFSISFSSENLENKIYKNLRCLVCQGQSIGDSNSDYAQTIKSVVKDKLNEGLSEKDIYKFLADKYGDWILYNTPFKSSSYLLWILPYVIFILGALFLLFIIRKNIDNKK